MISNLEGLKGATKGGEEKSISRPGSHGKPARVDISHTRHKFKLLSPEIPPAHKSNLSISDHSLNIKDIIQKNMDPSAAPKALSPPRLVRTAHADDDSSIFITDGPLSPFAPFGPQGSTFTVIDQRDSIPVNNRETIPSLQNTLPRCPPGGVTFCTTDIPPGGQSPMHRTLSLDYCIVMSGEIVLTLDSGEEKTIRAGETIVQQGVNHRWINQSQEACRIAFVMVGSEKLILKSGESLEETVFK